MADHEARPEADAAQEAGAPREAGVVQEATALGDEELDAYILARLAMLGVDLTVLPEEDPEAPADRARILASARRFLRTTPPAIADFELDPAGPPPMIYPAGSTAWGEDPGEPQ